MISGYLVNPVPEKSKGKKMPARRTRRKAPARKNPTRRRSTTARRTTATKRNPVRRRRATATKANPVRRRRRTVKKNPTKDVLQQLLATTAGAVLAEGLNEVLRRNIKAGSRASVVANNLGLVDIALGSIVALAGENAKPGAFKKFAPAVGYAHVAVGVAEMARKQISKMAQPVAADMGRLYAGGSGPDYRRITASDMASMSGAHDRMSQMSGKHHKSAAEHMAGLYQGSVASII